MPASRLVIKVGGSLLERASFVRDMERFLRSQAPRCCWVIVGGGEIVEAMRSLDQRFSLEPDWVHWQCIDLLQTTFELVTKLFPDWNALRTPEELERSKQQSFASRVNLVAVNAFYQRGREHFLELPESWATTTDSLAGLLALVVEADELVLLKSCEIAAIRDIDAFVASGVIDQAFPLVAPKIKHWRVEKLDTSL